jgi:hypothetical protein
MKWSDILSANGSPNNITNFKTFSNGSYSAKDQIAAYEGAFVLNNGALITIDIPLVTSVSGGRTASPQEENQKQELYDIGQQEWVVPISLKAGEIENVFGGIGMRDGASLSVDQFDDFNPPPIADYVEMSFPHPEHFIKHSTRDVVPIQSEFKWDFTLVTNVDGPVELQWDNTMFGDNSKELFLIDVANGILVDMRKQKTYVANPNRSRGFEIHFGENLLSKISPRSIVLGEAYPNPGNGDISIPFTLPENQASYRVSLEVFDQLGRKITSLVDQSLRAGFYTSQWESNQFNLNHGIYMYRLTVLNNGKAETYTKKIVLNK